jgi:dienelactone hydrolase
VGDGPDGLFDYDPREPLDLLVREGPGISRVPEARGRRLEFSSRGDRVAARLLLPPAGDGPVPVILLQHGAGGSKEAEYMDVACAPWLRAGAAIASIDFPLHGERAESKLGELLLAPGGRRQDLAIEFARQAVHDLRRTVDALERIPALDADRLAYAGFSLGTILGAVFCAHDPRPRAAALAIGGGGFGPPEVDPALHVGRIAPRPVLFVNTRADQTVPRPAAEALHAAANEPKEIAWFEGTHTEVPGVALKAMWTFLARSVGL